MPTADSYSFESQYAVITMIQTYWFRKANPRDSYGDFTTVNPIQDLQGRASAFYQYMPHFMAVTQYDMQEYVSLYDRWQAAGFTDQAFWEIMRKYGEYA